MKRNMASWPKNAAKSMPLDHALTAAEELLSRFAFEMELLFDARRGRIYFRKDYDTHMALLDEQRASDIRRRFRDLKRRKLVEEKRIGRRLLYSLTEKGRGARLKALIKGAAMRTDGKLVMVVFDVPWGREKERKLVRRFLRSVGFRKMQQSVWVSRCDVAPMLRDWVRRSNLGAWIRILLAEEVS